MKLMVGRGSDECSVPSIALPAARAVSVLRVSSRNVPSEMPSSDQFFYQEL